MMKIVLNLIRIGTVLTLLLQAIPSYATPASLIVHKKGYEGIYDDYMAASQGTDVLVKVGKRWVTITETEREEVVETYADGKEAPFIIPNAERRGLLKAKYRGANGTLVSANSRRMRLHNGPWRFFKAGEYIETLPGKPATKEVLVTKKGMKGVWTVLGESADGHVVIEIPGRTTHHPTLDSTQFEFLVPTYGDLKSGSFVMVGNVPREILAVGEKGTVWLAATKNQARQSGLYRRHTRLNLDANIIKPGADVIVFNPCPTNKLAAVSVKKKSR